MTHLNWFLFSKQLPIPFRFKYEVNVDDYTSFGDTRVGDEHGHVSGSYHVQLPDGRHQHVNYKDEGNGYVADVQYNRDPQYSASNVVEYKEKIDSGFKEHRKSPTKNSSKSLVKVSGKGKCTKANCFQESSYEKPKDQIYTEPVSDRPVSFFYHQIPSTTTTTPYKVPIYFNPASYSAPLVKGSVNKTAAQYVSITTEFPADNVVFTYAPEEYGFWQVMYTTPKYLKPSVSAITTTEKPFYITTTTRNVPSYTKPHSVHKTPSSTQKIPYHTTPVSTTTKAPTTKTYRTPYPATTSAYTKLISATLAYNRPAPKTPAVTKKHIRTFTPSPHKTPVTSKAPSTTTPVYKTPYTTKAYRIPVSITRAYRKPVPGNNPAYKKPLNPSPANKIPVSTTLKYSTTTPAYKTRYYTTKRNKVASDKAISKKPFAIYKPPSNKVPVKAIDPYVIAPSYHSGNTAYAAPLTANNVPSYTVILYKPNKQVVAQTKH